MSDVLQTAMNYRSRLKDELAKVDEFLRMAEAFSKESDPEARLASTKTTANATPPEKPKIDQPRASTNGGGAT